MRVCPYIEATFSIFGKKWNGQIIHYLSACPDYSAHFSEIKRDLAGITPKALSMKLSELIDFDLVKKNVENTTPVAITYSLTEKGVALAKSLQSIQEWAQKYLDISIQTTKGEEL